jgi:hypothetical protein
MLAKDTKFTIKKIKYLTEYDLVRKILFIYCSYKSALVGDFKTNFIRPRAADVLAYYIVFGYSTETIKTIADSLSLSDRPLTKRGVYVINELLIKTGYLVNDKYNRDKKYISKDLLDFVEFCKKENNLLLIKFEEE